MHTLGVWRGGNIISKMISSGNYSIEDWQVHLKFLADVSTEISVTELVHAETGGDNAGYLV